MYPTGFSRYGLGWKQRSPSDRFISTVVARAPFARAFCDDYKCHYYQKLLWGRALSDGLSSSGCLCSITIAADRSVIPCGVLLRLFQILYQL